MENIATDEFLVDVFYYDYILSKAIEIYQSGSSPSIAATCLQIATVLCKRIRSEGLPLDKQLYLKEMYLKVLQMLRFYEDKFLQNRHGDDMAVFLKGFECFKTIINEYPKIKEDPDFQALSTVSLVIYKKISTQGGKECLEKEKIWSFVKMLIEEQSQARNADFDVLFNSFSEATVFDYLRRIHFKNPIMKKFTDYIKKGIDEDREWVVTQASSSGDNVRL
ncbi:uncharacterized protein VICG_01247 [Vittaforma corneae ATCC 50505]|uniref:Uncharacterized protein n=1 Tax=Vittaforma corneae (strain ATCC 50505) TaxID=993615 RepID=L2GLI1_VITCO|nr:uncharacterized protein VICG_01247 [Vittaforma corneae ATCC 50505]ELA41743.1 hypothetical protein VICG_01247 [Vittaforma corneae ATCC 50505]